MTTIQFETNLGVTKEMTIEQALSPDAPRWWPSFVKDIIVIIEVMVTSLCEKLPEHCHPSLHQLTHMLRVAKLMQRGHGTPRSIAGNYTVTLMHYKETLSKSQLTVEEGEVMFNQIATLITDYVAILIMLSRHDFKTKPPEH